MDSEDSDQTGQMPRLIRVFAGRTCPSVGFVMRRLIYDIDRFCHDAAQFISDHTDFTSFVFRV